MRNNKLTSCFLYETKQMIFRFAKRVTHILFSSPFKFRRIANIERTCVQDYFSKKTARGKVLMHCDNVKWLLGFVMTVED